MRKPQNSMIDNIKDNIGPKQTSETKTLKLKC